MSELIAVQGLTLGFRDPTHDGTIMVLPASVTYPKVKCNSNQAYKTVTFSVTGFSGGAVPSGGTGGGSISGTSVKSKANGQSIVREEDQVTITVTGTGSPPPTQSTTVYVSVAGQTKTKAE